MHGEAGPFMVIQSGAPQLSVTQIEPQWPDQMQLCTGVGAQTDDVAGIGGNFRLVENDLEHTELILRLDRPPGFVVSGEIGCSSCGRDARKCSCDHPGADIGCSMAAYDLSQFIQGGAAGHDIIHDGDPFSGKIPVAGKGIANILRTVFPWQLGLRGCAADACTGGGQQLDSCLSA